MARIFHIDEARRRIAARKGFDPWRRRFGISFDENTSIRRLDSLVIKYLVRGNEESAAALYDLIMGMKGLGCAPRFHYLDSECKMGVTDISLFVLDMVRFETMFRLGWLEDYYFLEVALVDLVLNFQTHSSAARNNRPILSEAHPLYAKYSAEFQSDRHSFIRKLIPEAIKTFCDMEDESGT
jgi:hypothetical protein